MKALLRPIVTERDLPAVVAGRRRRCCERDPENRLLARGPRLRLPAEMIRDQALAVSGLLVERLGGPSVKPYQPAGLWNELAGRRLRPGPRPEPLPPQPVHLLEADGRRRRRWSTFDAPGRETCIVRESRTNTPLQALDLLNDVTFVEAARVLAPSG